MAELGARMTGRVLTFPERKSPAGQPTLPDPTGGSLGAPVTTKPRKPRTPKGPATPLAPARPPHVFSEEEQALQNKMLKAYFDGRRPSRNHAQSSIKTDRLAVNDLLDFIGQPLWHLTEGDFEVWSAHLGLVRQLAVGTQRRMQGSVCTLMRYLAHHQALQNEAAKFGGRMLEIGHSENRIIHSTDRNTKHRRKYPASIEFQDLLRVQDAAIQIAIQDAPRRARGFMRDKAMFLVYYTYGLRLAEGHGLNVDSFRRNTDIPALGIFGTVDVFGKGSNGSGPRPRSVPAILPDIRPLMEWYLAVVRPLYHPDDCEKALFLSESGKRLGRSSIAHRFKILLEIGGYEPGDLSMHGLRHMSISHEAEDGVSLHFTQHRHGHAQASTTQTYTHLSDDFIREAAMRLVGNYTKPEGDKP